MSIRPEAVLRCIQLIQTSGKNIKSNSMYRKRKYADITMKWKFNIKGFQIEIWGNNWRIKCWWVDNELLSMPLRTPIFTKPVQNILLVKGEEIDVMTDITLMVVGS